MLKTKKRIANNEKRKTKNEKQKTKNEKRKAKNEKRKAKNEKRKTKNKPTSPCCLFVLYVHAFSPIQQFLNLVCWIHRWTLIHLNRTLNA